MDKDCRFMRAQFKIILILACYLVVIKLNQQGLFVAKNNMNRRAKLLKKRLQTVSQGLPNPSIRKNPMPKSYFDTASSIVRTTAYVTSAGGLASGFVSNIINHPPLLQAVNQHLQVGSSALLTVNLALIPIENVYACLCGESVKNQLSKNGQFMLAILQYALEDAAIELPQGNMAFGLGSTFVVLGAKIVGLANLYYQHMQLQDSHQDVNLKMNAEKVLLQSLKEKAKKALSLFGNTPKKIPNRYLKDMESLLNKIAVCETNLLNLKAQKQTIEKSLEKTGTAAVRDHVISIGFSSLIMMGQVLSLMSLPAGLTMLTLTRLARSAYKASVFASFVHSQVSPWVNKSSQSHPIDHANKAQAIASSDEGKNKPPATVKADRTIAKPDKINRYHFFMNQPECESLADKPNQSMPRQVMSRA